MVDPTPSALPILARLEEAETIVGLTTEKITNEIEAIVDADTMPALVVGLFDCGALEFGASEVGLAVASVLKIICHTISVLLDSVDATLGGLLSGAAAFLNNAISAVTAVANAVEVKVGQAINSIVSTVADSTDRLFNSVAGGLESVVRSVGDFILDLIDRLERGVLDVLDSIGFGISSLINSVSSEFSKLLTAGTALIGRLDSTVRTLGTFLVDLAKATLDSMALSIAAVLGPLVGASQSVLARLGDLIETVAGAVKDATEATIRATAEFVGEPLGKMGSIFVTQIEAFFGAMVEAGNLSYGAILRPFFECFGIPNVEIDKIVCAADDAAPQTPGFFVAGLALMVPLMVFPIAGAALAPIGEQIQQSINRFVKPTLLTPADLLDGVIKGTVDESFLRDDLEQAGYREDRIDMLRATSLQAPDPSVQIQAWLRGLIEESELDTALAQNRMRPADVALLKQVVFFVPPAQDLIQMAVREVFSPEIRERFGQDEDFPEEFAKFAAQQGISDEWARAYWAAHWALPSPAQGFEMLHRKVIKLADLDVLLRALDVMPFWRDKLTQIAFSPLTRVDLRRMHALGLLTDAELQTRYEAIGFSADDAELMVAFTVVFNSSADELPEELEGLTRASILNMFEDGLIERDDAVALITRMGIGDDAAELYVEQRDLEVSRRERNSLIESIIGLAGGGRIGLGQAEDSLAQLGISAVEITRAIGRILGLIDDRDRLPSLAALTKMHKTEIIDDDIFLESIKALGFNDTWADREFALLAGTAES